MSLIFRRRCEKYSALQEISKGVLLERRDSHKASLSTPEQSEGKGYPSADARVIEAAGKANRARQTRPESEEMGSRNRKGTAEGA